MSVELLPGIGSLEEGSLCQGIYTQLYQGFFTAQDSAAVAEGDQTSVRLRNTAYNFASAIAGAVDGGGTGGVLLDYLKLAGGAMTGQLLADYGLGAGVANRRVLELYRTPLTDAQGEVTGYDYGMRLAGDLKVEGNHLYFGGQQFISYIGNMGTMFIRYPKMDFATSRMRTRGEMLFGENRATGIYLSPTTLEVAGNGVYHGGNANLASVDWTMRDAHVAGELTLSAALHALHGAELGAGGTALLRVDTQGVSLLTDLSFGGSYGVRMNGVVVLHRTGESDIRLGSAGGDLLLGGEHTNKVRLLSNLTDIDGDNVLITPYGGAYFPDSLRVRHNYGSDLLSTYRTDSSDEGIILHQKLRFGTAEGACLQDYHGQMAFSSLSDHTSQTEGGYKAVTTIMGHVPSMSMHKPQNRTSDTFVVVTEADYVFFNCPLEAAGHVGLDGSLTRLEDGGLFFTNNIRLRQLPDGIGHYGNAYFSSNVTSLLFSSGMAGSGWAILHNKTTGNTEATFDMLTVRKQLRAYEMLIQRTRAVGGALWISDTCSGDTVEKL